MRPAIQSRLVVLRRTRRGDVANLLPVWPARRSLSHQPEGPLSQLLTWKPAEKVDNVIVHGFVRSVRSTKKHSFIALGDGSSLEPTQALLPADQAEGISVGAAVRLVGSWVPSPGAAQSHELLVDRAELLGPSDAKKKYQTADYLRTLPHLRPRTPFNSALLRLRSDAVASLTHFFAERMFTQTHPPVITSSDCEGAGEVFAIEPAVAATTAEAAAAATATEPTKGPSPEPGADTAGSADPSSQDALFFRSLKYLTVSSQLHLEALAQAVGNVWTLTPTFRAERSDTSRHLSEFYMLEAEMAFVDQLGPVMDLAEDMLRSLALDLHSKSAVVREMLSQAKHRSPELAPLDQVNRRWEGMMAQSWPRITYTEALALLSPRADMFEHRPAWGAGLQAEHEKFLASFVGDGRKPVFVTDYPRDIKAFYMRATPASHPASANGQPPRSTVECFDLLVPDLCEIAGGSMREHRLANLLSEMQARGMPTPSSSGSSESAEPPEQGSSSSSSSRGGSLDWYVDLRRWGCPPHGGFGLGFDRLLCYLSGVQNIRDIVAFPRWLGRCDC